MTALMTGYWPTSQELPSTVRDRTQRLALAEARSASEPKRRVEAASPIPKLLVAFWRQAPRAKRAAA